MSITKPPVLPAWADTAVPTTDIVQPANSFITAGWLQSATPPARQYFNWILNFVANGIRYLCRRGLVDFDAAETYQSGDIVRGDDGLLRRSLINTNLNSLPSTSPTAWGALVTVTPTAGDNSSAIATTAFITGAISGKANTSGSYSGLSVGFATSAGSATTAGTAGSAGTVPWAGVQNKPTTVSGYGITDAVTVAGGQTVSGFVTFGVGLAVGGPLYINANKTSFIATDGTNVDVISPSGSGNLLFNGSALATQAYVGSNFLTPGSAAATYLTQAAAASTYVTQQSASTTYVAKAQIHIAADPGTVPAGNPGDVFEYY